MLFQPAKTTIKLGNRTNEGKDYQPFIKSREFNSMGTCSNITDWKHGRQMQLLSQIELGIYMQQRWRDDVLDIRERFPLDNEIVDKILISSNAELESKGHRKITRPLHSIESTMTTDLLLTLDNGSYEAISVVTDRNKLTNREIEKIWIEKKYWNSQGVVFRLMDKSDINPILVKNLRLVAEYYDKSRVYDDISAIKCLIANKVLVVDLESEVLDFTKYRELLRKEGCKIWQKQD